MSRSATPEDLLRICEELPETELGVTWGDVPTYIVPRGPKGRGFCLFRHPRHDAVDPATGEQYQDLVVIRTGTIADREALLQDERLPFITIEHFRRTEAKAVLVQRSRLGRSMSMSCARSSPTRGWRSHRSDWPRSTSRRTLRAPPSASLAQSTTASANLTTWSPNQSDDHTASL